MAAEKWMMYTKRADFQAIADEFPTTRVILILTKIDLVPRALLSSLLRTLSAELPVLLWKNTTLPPQTRSRGRKPARFLGVRKIPRQASFANFVFGPDYLMEVPSSPRFHLVSPKHPEIPRGMDQRGRGRVLRRGAPRSAPRHHAEFPAVPRR